MSANGSGHTGGPLGTAATRREGVTRNTRHLRVIVKAAADKKGTETAAVSSGILVVLRQYTSPGKVGTKGVRRVKSASNFFFFFGSRKA